MQRKLGPYELKQRLGVGGMAQVFLAHARRTGGFVQPCVVKVLHRELAEDESFSEMLVEEARLVAQLRHNNIASLYDVGRADGHFFLVMEYIEGRDLESLLDATDDAGRRLPVDFAIYVAQKMCAGLHFAHTRTGADGEPLELIHRDVSPPNVLISALGEVKLIDFGVAKFNSTDRQETRTGIIKGKFGYMSPEQAWDDPLDHRTDIFSVGVCLYEMLTGTSIYGQSNEAFEMLRRARNADVDPISDVRTDIPADLEAVVDRALEKSADDRFSSAHEMERQLAGILGRRRPDYTGLDAAAVLADWSDIDDPALASASPSSSSVSTDNAEPTEDRPSPISTDFSEAKTELFDDDRLAEAAREYDGEDVGADDGDKTILIDDFSVDDDPEIGIETAEFDAPGPPSTASGPAAGFDDDENSVTDEFDGPARRRRNAEAGPAPNPALSGSPFDKSSQNDGVSATPASDDPTERITDIRSRIEASVDNFDLNDHPVLIVAAVVLVAAVSLVVGATCL